MSIPEIYPPCGIKLGDYEPKEFICPAIILEGNPPDILRIDSILVHFCDGFVEEGSCPQLNSINIATNNNKE